MLVIRLSRIGKKNKSQYRIILQEKSKSTTSRFIEQVGFYNPHTDPATVDLKENRIKHWLSQGAQPSPTVHNLLIRNNILEGNLIPLGKPRKKKKKDKEEERTGQKENNQKRETTKEKIEGIEPKKDIKEKKESPSLKAQEIKNNTEQSLEDNKANQ